MWGYGFLVPLTIFIQKLVELRLPPFKVNQEACDRFGDIQACRSLIRRKSPFLGDSLNQKPPGLPV